MGFLIEKYLLINIFKILYDLYFKNRKPYFLSLHSYQNVSPLHHNVAVIAQ